MAGSQGDAPLSELCTICHVHVPKYRCPRCSTRTCSLPCSRRHKNWSQCSGIRDPAAYLRRNELATPAAFDQDFNFITGIERWLERAERDAESRGITLDHDYSCSLSGNNAGKKRKRPQEPVNGKAGFLRAAKDSGVTVERAPWGMTRGKQNISRWHTRLKCLSWNVEWIFEDGKKTLKTCLEIFTISGAYDRVYNPPKGAKRAQVRRGKGQGKASGSGLVVNELQRDVASSVLPCLEKMDQPPIGNQTNESDQDQKPKAAESNDEAIEPLEENSLQSASLPPHRNVYFYLHCPRIATNHIVLVPLDPNMTLVAALRNRIVLEFPTIYVLPYSLHELSTGEHTKYMLEDVYLQFHALNGGDKQKNNSPSEESDENDDGDDDSPDSDEDEEDDEEEEGEIDRTKRDNLN
ncbi:hypothetical protein Egran_00080 [Elaphomyces granulatus]|uniref:Box C/D snoRNA protein 1 n=1 Tax=Elaphomyces granulatus TaxID=519963 RepID=A0A232M6Y3_9EURO|nr:hypothetical protein Egran_00080 [Elaphomyces granulatus]